jgi:hypothetical protein
MQRMRCWPARLWRGVVAAVGLACALPVSAQQALGLIAEQCAGLDGNRQLNLASTAGIASGNVVVVAVAVRAQGLSDMRIVDAIGSDYRALGAAQRLDNRVSVALFAARVGASLPSGSTWRVVLRNGDANAPTCASITVFSDLVAGVNGLQWGAANSDTSNAPMLDSGRTGDGTPELLIGAVATAGTAINVMATPPIVALPLQCDSGGGVCLATLYRTGADSGPLALNATFGTSLTWVGALAVVDQDSLFRNGFE